MPASAHSSRLDIWDVEKARERRAIHLGFVQGFDRKCACWVSAALILIRRVALRRELTASIRRYELGRELGKGGFGVVRVVKSRDSGKEYACKSIGKHLDIANLPPAKQARPAGLSKLTLYLGGVGATVCLHAVCSPAVLRCVNVNIVDGAQYNHPHALQ